MDHQYYANAIFAADGEGAPKPLVSAGVGDYTIEDAYQVQSAYIKAKSENVVVAGYKAAVTGEAAQQSFGLHEPAGGVLFAPGATAPGARLSLSGFNRLVLETEFGFRLNAAVSEALSDPTGLVAEIHLMVELADAGFTGKQTGFDLIAGNVASCGFIEGPVVAVGANIDATPVSLERDGARLFAGHGRDALGGQMRALGWLINKVVSLGYTIRPTDILMTGALGGAAPGAAGHHVARFGDLGSIEFDVAD